MAAPYQNFRSSTKINAEKEELREARKRVLEKAKSDFEKAEKRREKARLAGEGTWMLSSVSDRIEKEQKEMEKVKKKKKEKKKRKKHKKEKKKQMDYSSSGSESSNDEPKWIEKSGDGSAAAEKPVAGPTLQRDDWMAGPLVTDIIPTVTREELRKRKKEEEEKNKPQTINLTDQPGQHSRELNPYWKEGGTGLPENKPSATAPQPAVAAGDGGLSWLKKAYERCKQQAQDEGRSLEEVAAERYGSLEKLESMIREAEGTRARPRGGENRTRDPHRDDRRYRRSRSPQDRTSRDRDKRDRDDRRDDSRGRRRDDYRDGRYDDRDRGGRERGRRCSSGSDEETGSRNGDLRDKKTGSSRDSHRESSRSEDRPRFLRPKEGSDDERQSSRSRQRFMKPGEDDGESRQTSQSRRTFVKPGDDSDVKEPSHSRPAFMKPGDGADSKQPSAMSSSSSSLKGRFSRPVDSDEEDDSHRRRREDRMREERRPADRGSERGGGGGWKKPEFKHKEVEKEREKAKVSASSSGEKRRRKSSSSSASSSSSDSSGSESGGEDEATTKNEPPPARILSEDEMNALGAKILRAELMGDDDLARQLKAQLEQAQKAKEAGPPPPPAAARSQVSKVTAGKQEEDNMVVLTRTGRDGMVRPLPEQEHDREGGGKRRKKGKNVDTHTKGGERTRYFDDDDKHDLKTLVQMEKLGTAEDQNMMFARLAGRSTEQTNDDFQVDDMFVSKAARQQSGARAEEKERSKAIFEHRKISAAMDKCQYCFSKVPKHLIIAIGTKVYLSLPAHRSLTPGHCLIVPMQHVSAATALDEDVWQEIQQFRKALVQMFRDRDQDLVVMETSMHLKHFPHMAIECVPLDQEVGDLAPIYFKKAIMEAGPEWSNNKKLVDLSKRDIRRAVPKGFPYFSVDFGLQGGYAHVIEDEKTFPAYFGREIVGGMIDAEPTLWRKPHREGFEDQRQKVLEFEQWWRPYDWTQQLNKDG